MDKPLPYEDEDQSSEDAADATLAPEAHNESQDDEAGQAQSLAEEALGRRSDFNTYGETVRTPEGGLDDDEGSMPDLVDHMRQMVTSGRIDLSAFNGERNDDDGEGPLGEQTDEDGVPRGAE